MRNFWNSFNEEVAAARKVEQLVDPRWYERWYDREVLVDEHTRGRVTDCWNGDGFRPRRVRIVSITNVDGWPAEWVDLERCRLVEEAPVG